MHKVVAGQYELFDLNTDPEEQNDLAAKQPERVEHLAQLLESHLRTSGAQRMRPNPEWDASRPAGKVKNYGIFYPVGGKTYQQVKEALPTWFAAEGE